MCVCRRKLWLEEWEATAHTDIFRKFSMTPFTRCSLCPMTGRDVCFSSKTARMLFIAFIFSLSFFLPSFGLFTVCFIPPFIVDVSLFLRLGFCCCCCCCYVFVSTLLRFIFGTCLCWGIFELNVEEFWWIYHRNRIKIELWSFCVMLKKKKWCASDAHDSRNIVSIVCLCFCLCSFRWIIMHMKR